MLYFKTKPDPVFMILVDRALRWELELIRPISSNDDVETWLVEYPALERIFSPYSALVTLEDLIRAHAQSIVYRPNEFHWLVLYECLKNYCVWHNDRLRQSGDLFVTIDDYRFGYLDFGNILEHYFWDQAFLALPPTDQEDGNGRCRVGVRALNDVLATGLRPYPSELRLTVMRQLDWQVPEPQDCGQWRLP